MESDLQNAGHLFSQFKYSYDYDTKRFARRKT
jgi:hypothetical protein